MATKKKFASINNLRYYLNKIKTYISKSIGLSTDIATIVTNREISQNTNYTIPNQTTYTVGKNELEIYYMGEKLIKNVHYKEVGTNNQKSSTIQFINWGMSVPINRTIEFRIKGFYFNT